ncbi:60S ribosomal protein L27B [Zalaria obscura]|uniref:60S ribosomal protein L27B n=1 Tax=Zalaria obscura TaxID=2024903 RepID=A0ACC3SFH7_9PEZI
MARAPHDCGSQGPRGKERKRERAKRPAKLRSLAGKRCPRTPSFRLHTSKIDLVGRLQLRDKTFAARLLTLQHSNNEVYVSSPSSTSRIHTDSHSREPKERNTYVLKTGRVAIISRGRYAGKKVVIIQPMDQGSKSHPFPHALVAGIERYPQQVTRRMSKARQTKRSKVKPFIKVVNYNHIMPTRYTLELEGLKGVVTNDTFKEVSQREEAKKTVKKALEERYTSGKNRWFFTPLRTSQPSITVFTGRIWTDKLYRFLDVSLLLEESRHSELNTSASKFENIPRTNDLVRFKRVTSDAQSRPLAWVHFDLRVRIKECLTGYGLRTQYESTSTRFSATIWPKEECASLPAISCLQQIFPRPHDPCLSRLF